MSTLVHMNICYPIQKSVGDIIGEKFVFVHDPSSAKYRVYNKMYTGTRTVSNVVYENPYIRIEKGWETPLAIDSSR